ncbi:MAG TPA: hypothetical protein VGD43_13205, partial [Micromonospora sp.]
MRALYSTSEGRAAASAAHRAAWEALSAEEKEAQRERSRQLHTTHGRSHTSEYEAWRSMRQRCFNEKHKQYPNYGGRGITVAQQWCGVGGFERFLADVGPKPASLGGADRYSLERYDVNGNYEPGNVGWEVQWVQARNKRNSRLVTINGVTRLCKDWAEIIGIEPESLMYRV